LDCEDEEITRREILEKIAAEFHNRVEVHIEGPKALDLVNPNYVADRCPHFRVFRQSLRTNIGWP
jgi:hypothetical protein